MESQTEKSFASPEVNEVSAAIKAVYDKFLKEKEAVKKEHRMAIDAILKNIDERKIKELKEKLKEL